MRLIIISSETDFISEIEIICMLFESGMDCFHLRKPQKTKSEVDFFLSKIPAKYHSRLVLHSHWDLTRKYNIRGIHLTSKHVKTIEDMKVYGHKFSRSASFHSFDEMVNLSPFNYVFLSPIYDSISKKNYQSHFQDKEKLMRLIKSYKQKKGIPKLIALGGVDATKTEELKSIGFDGVACIGAIFNQAKITPKNTFMERFNNILRSVNETQCT